VRVLALLLGLSGCGWLGGEAPDRPADATARGGKGGKAVKGRKARADALPEGPRAERSTGPNVLVIVWDTVRADRLSAYGHTRDTTPWLSAFAAGGVLFERAVSPGMWTLPSHASLFTGLPESAHGATAEHKWLDGHHTTLAETLWSAGYDTWLFSANPYLGDHTNLGQGFARREFPWDPAWKAAAAAATRAKILPDDASNTLGPKWVEGPYPAGRGNDEVKDAGPVVPEALGRWLDARPEPGRPWLAVVNYMEAHIPRIPSLESRRALFDEATIAEQLRHDQSYGYMLAATVGKHDFPPEAEAAIATVYDAAIRDVDAATATLAAMLEARGLLDDTVVVVTSDHGEHLGEHHLYDHKYSVYQPLVRVPLVVRGPGVPARREPAIVSNLGVFATVARLVGVEMPEGTLSRDLLAADSPRGEAYSELVAATPLALDRIGRVHPDLDRKRWLRRLASVEVPEAKCIAASDGTRELYDVAADPLESRDLAPADPARAAALCARIDAWRATFPAWDASRGERPGKAPAGTAEMLQQLGYLDEGNDAPAP
jgi:arylsulfatase A-like enzyme